MDKVNGKPGKPLDARDRPRLEPGSTVSFWCRASVHDQLVKMARDRRMSLSRLMNTFVDPRVR